MISKFKELRSNEGFTQKDLSEVFGVSQSTISHWENNVSALSGDTLLDISNFFDVSIDYLLENKLNSNE